jgi:hypothetical protein
LALRRGGRDELLLECDRLYCYVFVKDGGGYSEGRVGAGPRSGVEEFWRAPPADVPYRARSSFTGPVAIAAR